MQKNISKKDHLLALVRQLMEDHFATQNFTELEEIGMKVSVYDIFQTQESLDEIHLILVQLFNSKPELRSLIPSLNNSYNQIQ